MLKNMKPMYRDAQDEAPVCLCRKCWGEIYTEDAVMAGELCIRCFEEVAS